MEGRGLTWRWVLTRHYSTPYQRYAPAELDYRMDSGSVEDVCLVLESCQLHCIVQGAGAIALDHTHPVLRKWGGREVWLLGNDYLYLVKLSCNVDGQLCGVQHGVWCLV